MEDILKSIINSAVSAWKKAKKVGKGAVDFALAGERAANKKFYSGVGSNLYNPDGTKKNK